MGHEGKLCNQAYIPLIHTCTRSLHEKLSSPIHDPLLLRIIRVLNCVLFGTYNRIIIIFHLVRFLTRSIFMRFSMTIKGTFRVFVNRFKCLLSFLSRRIIISRPLTRGLLKRLLLYFTFLRLLLVTFYVRVATKIKDVSFICRVSFTIFLTRLVFNIRRGRSLLYNRFHATYGRNMNVLLRLFVIFTTCSALYSSFFFKSIFIVANVDLNNQNSSKDKRFLIFLRTFKRLRSTGFATAILMFSPN